MTQHQRTISYVRDQETPFMPPPANLTGWRQHLKEHYFSSFGSGIVTIVLGGLALWLAWRILGFAVVNASWSGDNREACLAADGMAQGACWPFVTQKLGQWIYGFYPVAERWRINLCFAAFAAGLIPMLAPSLPYKGWNVAYLLTAFPLLTFVLLTGGNFDLSPGGYLSVICLASFAATTLPLVAFGIDEGIRRNYTGLALAAATLLLWAMSVVYRPALLVFGIALDVAVLAIASGVVSLWALVKEEAGANKFVIAWCIGFVGLLAAMLALDFDFGLVPVETSQWGGLTVTLVVSVTGIVASLPLGILLALGRRSNMPALRVLSVGFIEFVRGVPLITVLFMASVMLPLFLPPGMNFDKLLRALVGVALFSSAYMAEVVRGGLQAIPKGQYEGAMALGLSYWQMMIKVILPQALKISIPNIVSNFIVLFKDTTLVLIIGLFDLLAIAQTGLRDAAWASPVTAPTGYLVIALIYWAFCFSMSRYATFTERRLHTGHKR